MLLPAAGVGIAILVILLGAFLGARRDEPLPTIYGRRRGGDAGRSVNGTGVLSEMFKSAGHRVTTFTRLSPKLERYDAIVWFPDTFKPPTTEQRHYLEQWLKNGYGRTVIYVGRDYNAALDYWDHIAPDVPPELKAETRRRQAEARAAWEAARSSMPDKEYATWFTARRDERPFEVKSLEGPFADGIDPKQVEIQLEGRLDVPVEKDRATNDDPLPEVDVLLSASGAPLITRITNEPDWEEGQILVVANGSFLLNYPLINHEHRQLAGRLIDECGVDARIAFVESQGSGPPIVEKEPTRGFPTALELLKIWPLNAILLHLVVLGLVLCLARSPIFGRPRELPADPTTDFGKHVQALGKLLARSKDRNYAQSRLDQYRQIAQRRSGRSHLKNK